jgi:ferredoxin--NADP+ reductase
MPGRLTTALTLGALMGSATAFIAPVPSSRVSTAMKAGYADNLKKSLSPQELREVESEMEKLKAAQDADLDPWFSEARADPSTLTTFGDLEGVFESATAPKMGDGSTQDFLEANPYYDVSNIPLNTFKNKDPFTGKVLSVKRIVGANAPGEVCHIIIDHKGGMPYWEGQSWGVIPPGTNPKNGKPHSVRLYSIASTRYGDDMTGKTGSLCVRRAVFVDPETGKEDPAKKGVCSNYLCDAKPGDEVKMTGPAGKVMLMPEKNPNADIIMVATGTGIAPYRSFALRLFKEKTPAAEAFKGVAWLFLGVANKDSLLYDDEFQAMKAKYPNNFRVDYALSREMNNKAGGKMYIQDKLEEYADEIFQRLDKGGHIYFCGLKGMMPGIQGTLEKVAKSKGIVYEEWLEKLKKNHQWHVEVY